MPSHNLFQRIARSSPYHWYFAALLPIALGGFMYGVEASEWERLRLGDPVPATGEFAAAECVSYERRGSTRHWLIVSNTFKASVYANDPTDRLARIDAPFTAKQEIVHASREACEAALPAVRRARAPHPVWYERGQPHASKTTLEEPDSTRFLWLCLGALPFVAIGAALHRRRWRRR